MAGAPAVDWFQIDWDRWRRDHPRMTFADQQSFYARVADLYPVQRSFDPGLAHAAFDAIHGDSLAVVELGGWDGALAAVMLGRGDIARWTNHDLVAVPQVCRDTRYELHVLDDYLWNSGPVEGDVFVACHTIEHLTANELDHLVDVLATRHVYLDAPLKLEPVDWTGYPGSHILEIGWNGVAHMLEDRGYEWMSPGLWSR